MKGILLAAGKGTRLYPMTLPVSKPLLPIFDKPMVYYPLSTLMVSGVRDILILTAPGDEEVFRRLLGDGSRFGVQITYKAQYPPRGIADAFLVGEEFIDGQPVALALGDNLFYGPSLWEDLPKAAQRREGAVVFGCYVEDPQRYGVVEFDSQGNVLSLEEKPEHPRSHYIVPGLYFYDDQVAAKAKAIEPSHRGELEITSVNNLYLQEGKLRVIPLGRDVEWLDAGTAEGLLGSAQIVARAQKETGRYVACLEEVAWRKGFISKEELLAAGEAMKMTHYGQYILSLAEAERGCPPSEES